MDKGILQYKVLYDIIYRANTKAATMSAQKDLIKNIELENTRAQMRKGSLEFAVLLTIAREEVYASDILKELKHADLIVVEGTLYPLLSRLRSSGILDYRWEESEEGPPRKYYTLTTKGKVTLDRLVETWNSLEKSLQTLIKKYEKDN